MCWSEQALSVWQTWPGSAVQLGREGTGGTLHSTTQGVSKQKHFTPVTVLSQFNDQLTCASYLYLTGSVINI